MRDMSSSHQSRIMSLEHVKTNYRNMVTKYSTYFQISQIVYGKGSLNGYLLPNTAKWLHGVEVGKPKVTQRAQNH